ncbi:MAG: hypothetical protein ACOYN0_08520 [Phycisphaerales bacterium]
MTPAAETPGGRPWTVQPRSFAVRLLLLSGLMAGCWYFLVRPWSESIQRDREELESMRAALEAETVTTLSPEQVAELNSKVLTAARQLTAWTHKASESSGLYDRIRRLAEAQKVKIGRIEPKSGGIVPPTPGGKAPERAVVPDIQTISYSVQVTGEYQQIAKFVDALEAGLGSSKVVSLRIVPLQSGSRQLVEATIETLHYRIASRLDERMTSASSDR